MAPQINTNMADVNVDIDGDAAVSTIVALLADRERKSHHFSHMHASL